MTGRWVRRLVIERNGTWVLVTGRLPKVWALYRFTCERALRYRRGFSKVLYLGEAGGYVASPIFQEERLELERFRDRLGDFPRLNKTGGHKGGNLQDRISSYERGGGNTSRRVRQELQACARQGHRVFLEWRAVRKKVST